MRARPKLRVGNVVKTPHGSARILALAPLESATSTQMLWHALCGSKSYWSGWVRCSELRRA